MPDPDRAELSPSTGAAAHADVMPGELDARRLARRAAQVIGLLGALVLVVLLAPGLDEVRDRVGDASPGWLGLAVVFEVLSSLSYVFIFRPVFCSLMAWRSAGAIGLAEVGAGAILPASGAGGVALGAWILSRSGMPTERIARRSVAFLLLKSSVNFVAVIVVGIGVFAGVAGPGQPVTLTLLPAGLAALAISVVVVIARLPNAPVSGPQASRWRLAWVATRRAIVTGSAEAGTLVRRRDPVLWAGIVGYWAWDNLALWAAFEAVGDAPGASVLLLGYLIGQLGGLLPIPGGIGGIDGGLIGTLVVYGGTTSVVTAAVLAYRVILFWIPLLLGIGALIMLRRDMSRPGGFVPCAD